MGRSPAKSGTARKREKLAITFDDAAALFIADCEARKMQPTTVRKFKLIARTLADFGPKCLKGH